MNNGDIIKFLLKHNKARSEEYCSPDQALARRKYRASHPTEIAALKCMDGRINLPLITEVPWGIIQPFRTLGGKFCLGWPYFGELVQDWTGYAVSKGRDCLLLVTYHWSKGDHHRGCKGFGYDLDFSRKYTAGIVKDAEYIYGGNHSVVYPIQVGIETDEDSLVLHGKGGKVLDLSKLEDEDSEKIRAKVELLFPDMKPSMIRDLMPLVCGNIHHIKEIRRAKRPVRDVQHGEDTVALGRGFSWLHLPNRALIIGPYSYDLANPIANAASIVLDNLEKGRIPKRKGVVFMVSALYRDPVGPSKRAAVVKARSMAKFAQEVISQEVPKLVPSVRFLVGTLDNNTMRFEPNPDPYNGF